MLAPHYGVSQTYPANEDGKSSGPVWPYYGNQFSVAALQHFLDHDAFRAAPANPPPRFSHLCRALLMTSTLSLGTSAPILDQSPPNSQQHPVILRGSIVLTITAGPSWPHRPGLCSDVDQSVFLAGQCGRSRPVPIGAKVRAIKILAGPGNGQGESRAAT
jgi:hypothetical protein